MKKFYTLIFTTGFLFTSYLLQAQTPWATVFTGTTASPLHLDLASSWQGGVVPPANCVSCAITINSPSIMTNLTVGPILNNSTLKINGNASLVIDTYVQVINSTIVVGSNATLPAYVLVNDQVALSGTSTIQLANVNTYIDANNSGGNPVSGPYIDYTGIKSAGIYNLVPTSFDSHGFTQTLNQGGNGSTKPGGGFAMYLINCNGASPNTCGSGIIYGPATTSSDATKGLVFTPSATLPVLLVQFLATKNADATIKLSWATAQEINSSSFDVERSADQGSWEKIGSVKAKGYSSIAANYSYTDQFPFAGNNYYRLKMIDLDGKFNYSKVVAVFADKDSRPLVIYSNPFSDQIRVKVNVSRGQNLTLTVSDIIGKTYLKQSYSAQAGDNLINLAPAGAASGMYVLHIQGNTYDQTVKLAKQ